jgi:hypothetical protein
MPLRRPKAVKVFCRQIASLFNSLDIFTAAMTWLRLPNVQCYFEPSYILQWYMVVLSPLILIFIALFLVMLHIVLWKGLGLRFLILGRGYELLQCARLTFTARSERDNQILLLRDLSSKDLQPEPELEFDDLHRDAHDDLHRDVGDTELAIHGPWQYRTWQDGAGLWATFKLDDQQQLIAAETQGQTTLTLQTGRYHIDLVLFAQTDTITGRRTAIRKYLPHSWGLCWAFSTHDWDATMQSINRVVLLYLMVGYIYLTTTSLQPITCAIDLDGSQWVKSAPQIKCDWCSSESLYVWQGYRVTYRTFATASVVFFTLYGLGVPVLFGCILFSHRATAHTDTFARSFGFLSVRTRIDCFWWETFISLRKLAMVVAVVFSDGVSRPCGCVVLSVLVIAVGAHIYAMPFANGDANLAEATTLLATILILITGIAHEFRLAGNLYEFQIAEENGFLNAFNAIIYTSVFALLGVAICVMLRRIRGAYFNFRNRNLLDNAVYNGRVVPDDLRRMFSSKWLPVSKEWAAIKARESADYSGELRIHDRVRPINGKEMGHIVDIDNETKRCLVRTECQTKLRKLKSIDERDPKIWQILLPQQGWENFELEDQRRLRDLHSRFKAGTADESASISFAGATYELNLRALQANATQWYPMAQIQKEGDVERMTRVLRAVNTFQHSATMKQWEELFPEWTSFFPVQSRAAMAVWAPTADTEHIEDMVWMMQELTNFERKQHTLQPCRTKQTTLSSEAGMESAWRSASTASSIADSQRQSRLSFAMERGNFRSASQDQSRVTGLQPDVTLNAPPVSELSQSLWSSLNTSIAKVSNIFH